MLNRYTILACTVFSLCACTHTAEDDGWLESYNRSMFAFNQQFNKYITKPVARGYRAVTTPDIRNRVNNSLYNITEPISAANHVLQGSFEASGVNLGRLLINTTLGLGGMFDVASGWGLKKNRTNFDGTLATWCVPDGPYIIVPLLGPATPRALTGYVVDGFSNPVYLLSYHDANYRSKIIWTYTGVAAIAAAERSLDLLDDLEKNSVDFYSAMKSTYLQNRQKYNECRPQGAEAPQSYDFDFEIDDDNF